MAAYPTLMTLRTSSTERNAGLQSARATNGALRLRNQYSADKADFSLVHWCSATEKNNLLTFYAANKLLNVEYTDPADGRLYVVRFVAAPMPVDVTPWWEIRVRLSEV